MRIIRVSPIWKTENGQTFLTQEAMLATPDIERPCMVETKSVVGSDGNKFEIAIFIDTFRRSESICLIPSDAPEWAEESILISIGDTYPQKSEMKSLVRQMFSKAN